MDTQIYQEAVVVNNHRFCITMYNEDISDADSHPYWNIDLLGTIDDVTKDFYSLQEALDYVNNFNKTLTKL